MVLRPVLQPLCCSSWWGAADDPDLSACCALGCWRADCVSWPHIGCVGRCPLVRAVVVLCSPVCPCGGWLCSSSSLALAERYAMREEMDITDLQSFAACPRQQWSRFLLTEYVIRSWDIELCQHGNFVLGRISGRLMVWRNWNITACVGSWAAEGGPPNPPMQGRAIPGSCARLVPLLSGWHMCEWQEVLFLVDVAFTYLFSCIKFYVFYCPQTNWRNVRCNGGGGRWDEVAVASAKGCFCISVSQGSFICCSCGPCSYSKGSLLLVDSSWVVSLEAHAMSLGSWVPSDAGQEFQLVFCVNGVERALVWCLPDELQ